MTEINYELLKRLAEKPHPLLNIADDFEKQIRETPSAWLGEVFTEARTAHHLHLSANTVKSHLDLIFERLGANDRAHAVALAFRADELQ